MNPSERNEFAIMLENAEAFAYVGMLSFLNFSDLIKVGKNRPCDASFITVAASNYVFSIELYLKSLWKLLPVKPKRIHNLMDLYQGLPPEIQTDLQLAFASEKYDERFYVQPITLTNTDRLALSISTKPRLNENDLVGLLERHKDGFVNWRYSHEIKSDPEMDIHISSLSRLAEAVVKIIDQELGKKGLKRLT